MSFPNLIRINRIRLYKTNGDGYNFGPKAKNLTIQYTTDTNSIYSRSWTNVTNLSNGFSNTELMNADSVNSDGTVSNDRHNSPSQDWASLMFDTVEATGIRIFFTHPDITHNHYQIYEFEAHYVHYDFEEQIIPDDIAENLMFGTEVSISGNYIAVGAHGYSASGLQSGSAYIFKQEGNQWIQQAKLISDDCEAEDQFGQMVDISGNYAIFSAHGEDDNGDRAGAAYIFKNDNDTWIQQSKLKANDGAAIDLFGTSVSIYVTILALHIYLIYRIMFGSRKQN